jgi:enamine deaminase RidA (YjgF/YER057c/UK114 family)
LICFQEELWIVHWLFVVAFRVRLARMFVTDISRWAEFGQAHHEYFADHPPATTMVEVQRLIDPAMLIEIEADAIVVTQSE